MSKPKGSYIGSFQVKTFQECQTAFRLQATLTKCSAQSMAELHVFRHWGVMKYRGVLALAHFIGAGICQEGQETHKHLFAKAAKL